MNTSFNNVALFIKRAEDFHTKEFIIEAFASNNIGKVSDVKFIKKNSDYGKTYNGVIVIFERWNMNKQVETLFNEMSSSPDGTTKFYFNSYRYWFINVHRQKLPECEETLIVESPLSDKEKISKLEELVKSMSAQIYYMQTRQEKSECSLMDLEHKEINHHLINMELRYQLEEKDLEKNLLEDEYKEKLNKIQEENEMLYSRSALNSIDMTRKEIQIENLEKEVRDYINILSYKENQINKIKLMLKKVSEKDPIKSEINLYIEEYLC